MYINFPFLQIVSEKTLDPLARVFSGTFINLL